MTPAAPIALSGDGSLLVCGDGPELLVHHGQGEPRWKAFCDSVLVGVAVVHDTILSCDEAGEVVWWRTVDGRQLDESPGRPAMALLLAADGTVASLTARGLLIHTRGAGYREVVLADAAAVSFGPDGLSVGVGAATGRFYAMEVASGAIWGEVALGEEVTAVGWSAQGHWVVCAGTRLIGVRGDGGEVLYELQASGPTGHVAVSRDGLVAACTAGPAEVAVFRLAEPAAVGTISVGRPVGGLGFGQGGQLAIGLDDGDANRVDLYDGSAIRTEPHPGRGRTTWRLDVRVDVGAVRGALAHQQAAGAAIATYTGWRPEDDEAERRRRRRNSCLGMAAGCGCLVFGCSGLLGLFFGLRHFGVL